MSERDHDANPYSPDEERIATWMRERMPDIGTGDDPIGFLLASYGLIVSQRNRLRDALQDITAPPAAPPGPAHAPSGSAAAEPMGETAGTPSEPAHGPNS